MAINSGFDNFIPEVWSARLTANLNKLLTLANLVNTDYNGEITAAGDVVRINKLGDITVSTYTGSITYQAPSSTQTTLTIDNDYSFSFAVDDLDEVQSNIALIDGYTMRAAYSLADTIDQDLAAEYANAGLADISWDVGTDGAYSKLVDASVQLDDANVPSMGRWLVVTPTAYGELLKDSSFIASATETGRQVVTRGFVGSIAGFDVFKSVNLVNTTASTYAYMYGTREAITHARQLTGGPEAIRLESSFQTGIRGRLAWGNAVPQANALGVILGDET